VPRLAASVDELQAPIGFAVVRGELSVELPAGSAPSTAPALTMARVPVMARVVLDPAVLSGGAVFDAWGPIAHNVAFGNDGARLTKGFIGVRMLEVPGGGDGGLRVEGQLSGVLAGGAAAGVVTGLSLTASETSPRLGSARRYFPSMDGFPHKRDRESWTSSSTEKVDFSAYR